MYYFGPLKYEVFTLGSKHWRAIQGPPNTILQLGGKIPTIFNGIVHFLAYCSKNLRSPDTPVRKNIAAFDLKTEEWSVLPIPRDIDLVYELSLMQAEGLLLLACLERKCGKLDMWALKHYDNRMWVKEYSVDYTDCMDPYLLTIVQLRNYDNTLQYSDSKDERFEVIHAGGEKHTASLYVESFSSLNIRGFEHKDKPVTLLQKDG